MPDYMITKSFISAGVLRAFVIVLVFISLPSAAAAQDTDSATQRATPVNTPTAFDNPGLVLQYQSTITAEDLAAHLYFFASDFFEGRETSTRGQKLAAQYLASQYRKMGVAPKGTKNPDNPMDPSAYFQPFDLYGSRIGSVELSISEGGTTIGTSIYSATETDGQSYLVFGSTPEVTGGLVFGGYGIGDDGLAYNDFKALEAAGISAQESWLMVLADEPLESAEKSLLATENGEPSAWTTRRFRKISAANSAVSPKGILLVVDSSPRFEGTVADAAARSARSLQGVGSLSLEPRKGNSSRRRTFPPVFAISRSFADKMLKTTGKTIEALQKQINASLTPVVMAVPGVEVSGRIRQDSYTAGSENVVAYIEGSDPDLKDEVVVISSHYDHIGMRDAGDEDGISNGADDDGSGTVAVLEIAEAFAKARDDGVGPRRSILFLNVAGEEKGLLGSAYYTDSEPILPLENTVTNLNIDMIGRIDPTHPGEDSDYVYIIGSNLISQELHDINQRVNELVGINLDLNERFNSKDDPNQFYRRSDHWNFGKNNIPFIFFFTGTHEDYHGVGDEPGKIEYERMSRISQLIFATAWQIANQDERPATTGTGFN